MDKSFLYHHLKTKRIFLALCGFSLIAYVALVLFLLRALFFEPEVIESLKVETSVAFQKLDGKGVLVKVTGHGFDENVGAYLAYDAGNRGAIVGSLPTWDLLRHLVVQDNKAYLANRKRGFQIADISNRRQPVIIGSVDTPGAAWAVAVSGSYAYVADGSAGLQVIAIGDSQRPRIVANLPLKGHAVDVLIAGDRELVATREHGVTIVSVSQPQQPFIVAEIADEGISEALALSKNRLFVAKGKGGVWEYGLDVMEVGRLIRKLKTSGPARSVAVSDTELFVGCGQSGLDIFLLAGTAPELSVSVDTPGSVRGVAVVGEGVYVADHFNGLQILERHAAFGWRIAATVDTPGTAGDVVVDGKHIYVVDGKSGLQIISLANIEPSTGAQRVATPGYVRGLVTQGDTLYVADGTSGLHRVSCDASGECRIVASTPGYALDVAIQDDHIYVAAGIKGLHVLTVKQDESLRLAYTVKLAGVANAVTVVDNLVVVAAGKAGLYIVDMEGPAGPRVIGHLGEIGYVRDVAVVGKVAFVAAKKAGLLQISLEEPTAPRLVGVVDLPLSLKVFAQTLAVSAAGDKMLVANARAGCQVYDISVPEKPRFLTSVASMEYVKGVNTFGDRGYLFDSKDGVRSFDLKTLQQLRLVNSEKLTGLAVTGGKAYLGHGNGGVSIVPLPTELAEINLHSSQELSVFIPTPAMPGRYSLWLTKGEQNLVLAKPLSFEGGGFERL